LLDKKDYRGLERLLADMRLEKLAQAWPGLAVFEKLIVFKLLDAVRALEFFGRLPFPEKYFLFCGFPLQAIAPVLEDLPAESRRAFVSLPREVRERMFRQLL
jgi:Mg/Co/Ni transporter MgtE